MLFKPVLRMLSAAVAVTLASGSAFADEPKPLPANDSVDAAVYKLAQSVMEFAGKENLPSIGVVKVMVAYGDNKPLGSSELSQSLAGRLEVALILAAKKGGPVVLKEVGKTAAQDKAATHTTEDGAKKFFLHKYNTAWGEDKIEAGALVLATAKIAPALDKIDLSAAAIMPDGKQKPIAGSFASSLTARTLSELGMAYRVSSENKLLVYGARGMDLALVRKNVPERVNTTSPPIAKPDDLAPVPGAKSEEAFVENPIKFVILYNGKEVPVNASGSHLKVPTPSETDEVSFKITNTGKETVGVVLKINGENSLQRTTCPDDQCKMWVIDPGKTYTLEGFVVNKVLQKFKVLAPSESDAQSVRYGEHAGTFRLAVFAGKEIETAIKATTPPTDDDGLTQIAIARGGVDIGPNQAGDLTALKKNLRDTAQFMGIARGLVVPDLSPSGTTVETKKVKFVLNSKTPIVNMPIWYYEPADKKDLPKVSD